MPSSTFFRLEKEKQEKLLASARDEFSRCLYPEASLNRIIKEAEIARGTFYLYFTDKEDLYFYLLDRYRSCFDESFLNAIQKHQGDFLEAIEDLYEILITEGNVGKEAGFFKNLFLNMHYNTEKKYLKKTPEDAVRQFRQAFFASINPKLYVCKSDEELLEGLHLAMMVTLSSLAGLFLVRDTATKERAYYQRKMTILKRGLYRKEKKK